MERFIIKYKTHYSTGEKFTAEWKTKATDMVMARKQFLDESKANKLAYPNDGISEISYDKTFSLCAGKAGSSVEKLMRNKKGDDEYDENVNNLLQSIATICFDRPLNEGFTDEECIEFGRLILDHARLALSNVEN